MSKWLAALAVIAALGGAGLYVLGGSLTTTFENVGSPLDPEPGKANDDDVPGVPSAWPDADVSPDGGGSFPDTPGPEKPAPSGPPDAPSAPADPRQVETAFWQSVMASDDPELYRAYLRQYPDGPFSTIARAQLERMSAQSPAPQPSMPAPNAPPRDSADQGFPWPPPKASARHVIDLDHIPGIVAGKATIGDISDAIVSALERAGYFDRSYFELEHGAAIVTRLERIRADGYPQDGDARWPLSVSDTREFSLAAMLKGLFFADPGFFRVIVFIISDQPFRESGQAPTAQEATEWLNKGFNTLPESAAARPSTARHAVTALIYEFERAADDEQAYQLVPGQLPGATHIRRAGIRLGAAQDAPKNGGQ
ncbi:MAG: hypothetical protein R3D43_10780 [Tepidamorphaceae bacterium]